MILAVDEPTGASSARDSRLAAVSKHALRLFREKGYETTTIDEIAQRAGISRRTFFNYFETKAAVFWYREGSPHEELTKAVQQAGKSSDPWGAVVAAHVAWASSFTTDQREEFRDLYYLIDTSADLRSTLYDLNHQAAATIARTLTPHGTSPFAARMTYTAALSMAFCGEQTQRAWSRDEVDNFPAALRSSLEAIADAFRTAIVAAVPA